MAQHTPDAGCVRAWADAFGMPKDYTAVDLESSGLDVDRDYVLQLGWCRVEDCKSVENAGVCLNHAANMSPTELNILDHRLATTAESMQSRGNQYTWDMKRVRAGDPPKEAVAKFIAACSGSEYVVSHYGTAFDYPMIDRLCRMVSGEGLPELGSGRLIDTAVIYKAAAAKFRPRPNESIASATARVLAIRGSIKFSMSTCIDNLGLVKSGVVARRAHDAIYDSWLCSLVYESLRKMAEGGTT